MAASLLDPMSVRSTSQAHYADSCDEGEMKIVPPPRLPKQIAKLRLPSPEMMAGRPLFVSPSAHCVRGWTDLSGSSGRPPTALSQLDYYNPWKECGRGSRTDMIHHNSRFGQALVYAETAHTGQLRKGTTVPYVAHLLGVAALALEHGANEDEAIAALLHDTVEDCGGLDRLGDVRERFGPNVADIVMGCTDATEIPKPPWKERKQAYVHDLAAAPPSVLLVSACDKLHNVRSLVLALRREGEAAWRIFKGGKEGTLWYHRAVLDVLSRRGAYPILVGDLKSAVEEVHRLASSDVPLSDVRFPDSARS
jgi:hypothetical protein